MLLTASTVENKGTLNATAENLNENILLNNNNNLHDDNLLRQRRRLLLQNLQQQFTTHSPNVHLSASAAVHRNRQTTAGLRLASNVDPLPPAGFADISRQLLRATVLVF
jgi:hypothetical protein